LLRDISHDVTTAISIILPKRKVRGLRQYNKTMETIIQILFVFFLIILNGFFVAAEFSLVSARKTRIDEIAKKGGKRAKLVQQALRHISNFISATQLGITLSSLALGWIGEPFFAKLLAPFFISLPLPFQFVSAEGVAIFFAFTIITFFHIILGELVPKNIALQKSETVARLTIVPLMIFSFILKPFIFLLNNAGSTVLKVLGFSTQRVAQVHSEEEIKMILTHSGKSGVIPQDEIDMVYNVFNLGDTTVKKIMVPRPEIVAFYEGDTLVSIFKVTNIKAFSRYPVYRNSLDDIVGFIHIKDIYREMYKRRGNKRLSQLDIIRKILTVTESAKLDRVLINMQRLHLQLAVVVNEQDKISGLVTLEDIVEGVVGEIEDEFDKPSRGASG